MFTYLLSFVVHTAHTVSFLIVVIFFSIAVDRNYLRSGDTQ